MAEAGHWPPPRGPAAQVSRARRAARAEGPAQGHLRHGHARRRHQRPHPQRALHTALQVRRAEDGETTSLDEQGRFPIPRDPHCTHVQAGETPSSPSEASCGPCSETKRAGRMRSSSSTCRLTRPGAPATTACSTARPGAERASPRREGAAASARAAQADQSRIRGGGIAEAHDGIASNPVASRQTMPAAPTSRRRRAITGGLRRRG
jgi:hypothetical protein